MTDPINAPAHYTFSKIEPLDAIEAWGLGFHLGNVVKYVARAERKGGMQDILKAQAYLNRYIELTAKEANDQHGRTDDGSEEADPQCISRADADPGPCTSDRD